MSTLEETVDAAFGEEPEFEPAAEVEAPPEGASEEGTPVAEAPEQPRDEQGRFAPKASEDPDVQRFLSRFDGDVDKALRAAVEADSMIGRQGQQMGELQKQLAEIQQAVTPQPQQQGVPITQEYVDWFDEQVAQNPQQAAVWAMQNDPTGTYYNRAMETWFEESPRDAARFETELQMAAYHQQLQQQQAPLYQNQERQEFAAAWSQVREDIPDLDQHTEAILQAAQETPEIVSALQNASPEAKQRVIRNLYKLAKFEQANQIAATGGTAPPETNTAAESFVASATQRVDPETKDPGDEWFEKIVLPHLPQHRNSE